MTYYELPPGWGDDQITKFINAARANSHATFFQLRPIFQLLVRVDSAFRTLLANLDHTEHWFTSFFALRAHSNFLAATRLAISCQIPETYLPLRSSLENALYGFRIFNDHSLAETWLRRHDSKGQKNKMREAFRPKHLFRNLSAENLKVANTTQLLYERCIDYGGHPNKRALAQMLKMTREGKTVRFDMEYLSADSLQLRLALRTTAQVGLCVLGIFRLVYKERFDLVGLTEVVDQLRKGL
jgi:hypothetical protein